MVREISFAMDQGVLTQDTCVHELGFLIPEIEVVWVHFIIYQVLRNILLVFGLQWCLAPRPHLRDSHHRASEGNARKIQTERIFDSDCDLLFPGVPDRQE